MQKIETEEQYKKALARLDQIFEAELGTPEGEEALELIEVIEQYEQKHYPME